MAACAQACIYGRQSRPFIRHSARHSAASRVAWVQQRARRAARAQGSGWLFPSDAPNRHQLHRVAGLDIELLKKNDMVARESPVMGAGGSFLCRGTAHQASRAWEPRKHVPKATSFGVTMGKRWVRVLARIGDD